LWWIVAAVAVLGIFVSLGFLFFQKSDASEHLIASTPSRGEIYAAVPINITLTFDSVITSESPVKITHNGEDVTTGDQRILDQKTLQKDIDSEVGDGEYFVSYNACFENKKCLSDQFSFSVQKDLQKNYVDLRNQETVQIDIVNKALSKTNILVSPGTTIEWTNKDLEQSEITTETFLYPEYFSSQNSGLLQQNDIFRLVFILQGQYNYQVISKNETLATGSIIVKL
jgi:methionine-rich copper-binding protein CopC